MDSLLPAPVGAKATSLGELVRRRMGERVLDDLVVPIAGGVHSTHPDQLDPDRVAPGLRAALLREGSLARAVLSLRARAAAGTAGAGDPRRHRCGWWTSSSPTWRPTASTSGCTPGRPASRRTRSRSSAPTAPPSGCRPQHILSSRRRPGAHRSPRPDGHPARHARRRPAGARRRPARHGHARAPRRPGGGGEGPHARDREVAVAGRRGGRAPRPAAQLRDHRRRTLRASPRASRSTRPTAVGSRALQDASTLLGVPIDGRPRQRRRTRRLVRTGPGRGRVWPRASSASARPRPDGAWRASSPPLGRQPTRSSVPERTAQPLRATVGETAGRIPFGA